MAMDKLTLDRPIIVEGKYDKIRLMSVASGIIITTEGFNVFKNTEKRMLIKRLAEKSGVYVLTDSDGGGLVIRNFIGSILPKSKIKNIYIPEIKGREKRKSEASREGLLGVEGIASDMLYEILKPFSVGTVKAENTREVTKADLYSDGFSGGQASKEKREKLCKELLLPTNISSNALLEAINLLYSYDKYKELAEKINRNGASQNESN